jgi:3-oxoacyl-[acyl-carrier-protein] synthase III
MYKINSILSAVTSTGSYLPKKTVTNDDLAKTLNTSDEWIFTRTGIKTRHISDETETTAIMAANAGKQALKKNKKIIASDIEGIIVATTTPDMTFPSVAAKVQALLNIKSAFAFDIQAICSGFLYALHVANSLIKSGTAKNILVIGSERMSKILNWEDRSTCVLFGDGAGAVILSAQKGKIGIIDSQIKTDGTLENILYTTGGTSTTQTAGHLVMEGKEVFKHAVEKMISTSKDLLKKNNQTASDIKWIVPHQANHRIMLAVTKKLGTSQEKLISTIDKHANTSAASIPIALDINNAKFKQGDLILLIAAGAGFTWGSALIRW